MSHVMRAKVEVVSVIEHAEDCHEVVMMPVSKSDGYPEDGRDEDNSFARWTPSGEIRLTITNPDLLGKLEAGQRFYVDFTSAD